MERKEIFTKVLNLIENCDFGGMCVERDEIKETSDLITDIGFDSLDKVELIILVEDEFHINIDEIEENSICTIKDLIDIIKNKK